MSAKKCCGFLELRRGVLVIAGVNVVFASSCLVYFVAIAVLFGGVEDDKEYDTQSVKVRIVCDLVFTVVFLVLQCAMVLAVFRARPDLLVFCTGASVGALCFLLGRCVYEIVERFFGTAIFILVACCLLLYFVHVVLDYAAEIVDTGEP